MAAAPDDRQAQLDYAIDIGNIANVQLQRGEHEAAIEAFTRSLEVRQRIAHGDPKDMHAQSRVAFVHTKLATLYVRTGRVATAREHARRAATLLDPLTGAADAYRSQQFMALRTLGDVERNAGRGAAACQAYRTAHRVGPGQPINVPLEETIRHVDRAVAECDRASSGVDLLAPRRQRGARPMFNP
jgi:tetratricopeptide (TPR) repeat protein